MLQEKTTGSIFQLNYSDGGVPKRAIEEAELTRTGLVVDRQAHPKIHGGPDKALCLYSLERIEELQAEGHPISPGSVGENVTISGLDWSRLKPGDRLALGNEVLIEISGYANPCKTIARSFIKGNSRRISQQEYPGQSRLYARVINTGRLMVGQTVRLVESNGAQ